MPLPNALSTIFLESAKVCAPRALLLYVPHALAAIVPQMSRALHAVLPHVPHTPCALAS